MQGKTIFGCMSQLIHALNCGSGRSRTRAHRRNKSGQMPSPFAAQIMHARAAVRQSDPHTDAALSTLLRLDARGGSAVCWTISASRSKRRADGGEAGEYFLGTMLFIEPERPAFALATWPLGRQPRVLEVVDGLQRLTTLTMLFCVLRDLDRRRRPAAERPRLLAAIATGQGATAATGCQLREPDEAFFQTLRARAGRHRCIATPTRQALAAEERIIEVRESSASRPLQAYDAAQRQRLADFLLDQCYVVVAVDDAASTAPIACSRCSTPRASRWPATTSSRRDLLGGVPPAAMAAAPRPIWDRGRDQPRRAISRAFSAMFAPCMAAPRQPSSSGITEHRRRKRAAARRLSSACCSPPRQSSTPSATPGTRARRIRLRSPHR